MAATIAVACAMIGMFTKMLTFTGAWPKLAGVIQILSGGHLVIALFLLNFRMSLIILIAIPVSFIATAIVFAWCGLTVNTMTLGGLAVAVGELVDSAIVGAENIYRRIRGNLAKPEGERRPFMSVISRSTNEVVPAIVLSRRALRWRRRSLRSTNPSRSRSTTANTSALSG